MRILQHKPRSLFLLVPFLFLLACEETTDWTLNPTGSQQLVVEAILTNEEIRHEIKLSQTVPGLNDAPPPVSNAEIFVSAGTVIYPFAETLPGTYRSLFPFAVIGLLDYRLVINWQGREYTATSRLSPVAPIPELSLQPFGITSDSLIVSQVAPLYNANQQAMYEVQIDWSHLSAASPNRARMLFYTFNSVDASAFIRPQRDTVAFPRGSIITTTKFGLNEDFANYLRALVIETDWNGGIYFYGPRASLPTNISDGAVGFFSTCSVLRDTVVAN